MKIAVLEKTNFSEKQIRRLKEIGEVDFYDGLSQEAANEIGPDYDVAICNWLDPTPFILSMKSGSMVALLSTGYGWITNLAEAREKNILVSNIPGYSTEAVAEHLLGMLLGVSKNIFSTLNGKNNGVVGFELKGKTIGIIGLGNIGRRFAEIMDFFGANIITYNRHKKYSDLAEDVSLEELLSRSDIICITCAVNDESKNLINGSNWQLIKKGAVMIGSTWGIMEQDALTRALAGSQVAYASFDAALEASDQTSITLKADQRVFLTPHIAYNTSESEERQLDICVRNIEMFHSGTPQNIVN